MNGHPSGTGQMPYEQGQGQFFYDENVYHNYQSAQQPEMKSGQYQQDNGNQSGGNSSFNGQQAQMGSENLDQSGLDPSAGNEMTLEEVDSRIKWLKDQLTVLEMIGDPQQTPPSMNPHPMEERQSSSPASFNNSGNIPSPQGMFNMRQGYQQQSPGHEGYSPQQQPDPQGNTFHSPQRYFQTPEGFPKYPSPQGAGQYPHGHMFAQGQQTPTNVVKPFMQFTPDGMPMPMYGNYEGFAQPPEQTEKVKDKKKDKAKSSKEKDKKEKEKGGKSKKGKAESDSDSEDSPSKGRKDKKKKSSKKKPQSESESEDESPSKGSKDKKNKSSKKKPQSESDSEESPSKATKDKKKKSSKKKPENDSNSDDSDATSSKKTKSGKKESSKVKRVSIIADFKELVDLGKFIKMDSEHKYIKAVKSYVKNSCGVSSSNLTIHGVRELAVKKSSKPKTPMPILLFYKTSPETLENLQDKNSSCLVFYDRLAGALAVPPENLAQPMRQIVLLCEVDPGNQHKSQHGYDYWKKKGPPKTFDSVKAIGSQTVDWKKNWDNGEIQIPRGKTAPHGKFKSYEVEYSQYIIFEGKSIKVRFAVDVEVSPSDEGK